MADQRDNSGKQENFVYITVPVHLMGEIIDMFGELEEGDSCSTTEEDSSSTDIEMTDSFIEDGEIPDSDSYEPSEDEDEEDE